MPAQQLPGMAIDHERERGPAIPAGPDAGDIRGPAFVRRRGDGWNGLDAGPHADGPLPDLPALEPEDPLHRVLVEAQEPGHGAIAEGGLLLDHRLDRLGEARIDPRSGLHRLVVDRAARHAEPGTEPGDRHRDALGAEALLNAKDQFPSCASSRACNFFRARSSSMASP